MREGLAVCPGWGSGGEGRNHRTRGPRGPLPTAQLLLILNSWHIMGMQALAALSMGGKRAQVVHCRVLGYNVAARDQPTAADSSNAITATTREVDTTRRQRSC